MSSTGKDVIATYGLTPRDVEVAIKALATMVESNQKPDLDKLAKSAGFKDGVAAGKGWWATRKKLQAAGKANANDNATSSPAGTPTRKRKLPTATAKPKQRRSARRKEDMKADDGNEAAAVDSDGDIDTQVLQDI